MPPDPPDAPSDSPFSFSWPDFLQWFETSKVNHFEPARSTFERILKAKLDSELSQFERQRIRVGASRVKSPARLWAKMTKQKYRSRITDLNSIPTIIDDLVGLRIICNNLSDVTRLQEILGDLPSSDSPAAPPLGIEPSSEKHYFEVPKESGYRAYHLNLVTTVTGFDDHARIRGEIQVRTLLQDGWGELTHEDTYKPGVTLPDLATTIALRMADLLATVDDLAQDLRNELDRLAENEVSDLRLPSGMDPEKAIRSDSSDKPGDSISSASREAILAEVRSIISSLTRPAPVTDVARQLQSKFGTDLARDWAGYNAFSALLTAAQPDVRTAGPPPGTILPPGATQESGAAQNERGLETPAIVRRLRTLDRNTPTVGRRKMDQLLREVHATLRAENWELLDLAPLDALSIRDVNKLTKEARAAASTRGELISRNHLDYLFKALLWNQRLAPDLDLDAIRASIATHFANRATIFGITPTPADEREVKEWLAGDPDS